MRFLLMSMLLFVSAVALADPVYKSVNEQGQTQYSQDKTNPDAEVVMISPATPSDEAYRAEQERAARLIKAAKELEQREQKQRTAREREAAKQEKKAAAARKKQQQDASLIAQCEQEGHNYCDSVERIRAAKHRRRRH